MNPCLYVLRYANNLEFGEKTHEVTMTALRLVQRMKKDNIHYGRRPSGLCGAALLVASRLHEFNRTVGDIVRIVHIHESTLRKRLVEFGETPSSSLTLDEFMSVDLEEEQDPPSYKAARSKDRERVERLQKLVDEIDANTQLTELQQEIEKELEVRRALKRPVVSTNTLPIMDKSGRHHTVEESDTDKFVTQSTLGVIEECIGSGESEKRQESLGLGPTDAMLGLDRKKGETNLSVENKFENETGELDLEDIDDDEIDGYILKERDVIEKDKIWMSLNAEYLEEQKIKEERLAKEREEGKPEKKKKKYTGKKNRNTPAANTAGEAIEKMIQEKKISTKINYDVLKSLNVSFSEDGVSQPIPQEPQKPSEPEIILPPPKSVSISKKKQKQTPQSRRVKSEPKQEPVNIKETVKEEAVIVAKTDPAVMTGESSDAEQDLELDEYEEEEEAEVAEQTMSLSQLLNQHRDDDNYYGYDDDDY